MVVLSAVNHSHRRRLSRKVAVQQSEAKANSKEHVQNIKKIKALLNSAQTEAEIAAAKVTSLENNADHALLLRAQGAEAKENELLVRAQNAEAKENELLVRAQSAEANANSTKHKQAVLTRQRLGDDMRKAVRKCAGEFPLAPLSSRISRFASLPG